MPKYIAIAAITLDGKIAQGPNHMSSWTSKEDKDFLHRMLDKCDVVLVGNNTYKTAIKPLSKRNCIVLTRAAPLLPLGEGAAMHRAADEGSVIYCNPQKSDIKKLIRDRKHKTVAILGGAQTYTFCLQNNLLDELYLTIEPIVFGHGMDLFSVFPLLPLGEGTPMQRGVDEGSKKSKDYKFKLLSIKKLNKQGSLLLHYKK